jgi:hypothetical protein
MICIGVNYLWFIDNAVSSSDCTASASGTVHEFWNGTDVVGSVSALIQDSHVLGQKCESTVSIIWSRSAENSAETFVI